MTLGMCVRACRTVESHGSCRKPSSQTAHHSPTVIFAARGATWRPVTKRRQLLVEPFLGGALALVREGSAVLAALVVTVPSPVSQTLAVPRRRHFDAGRLVDDVPAVAGPFDLPSATPARLGHDATPRPFLFLLAEQP